MARLGKIGVLATMLIVGLVGLARAEESLLARLEKEVRTLAERTGPAVVKVTGAMTASFIGHDLPNFLDALLERSGTVGTGFVVSKDGLVVTTHRVARRAETARIEFSNGIVRDGQVLGSDAFFQVALVRVEPVEGIEPLVLSTAEDLPDGSLGVFVGNSFGTRNISLGVVARAGRQPRLGGYDNYLVMNAPIHPGDEGGPLVGPKGEVVAMGAGRHSGAAVVQMGVGSGSVRLRGLTGSPGIGLLVPSADLRFAIDEIEEHGRVRHGKLGIHLKPGALEISEVRPDTPAEKSGLRTGDVILRVSDKKLETDADLRFTLRRTVIGTRFVIRIRRAQEEITVESGLTDLGVPTTAEVFPGVRVLTEGPPVVAVVAGLSEFRPGDRILATNGKKVESAADVLRILSLRLEPLRVEVEVLRGEKRLTVKVPR